MFIGYLLIKYFSIIAFQLTISTICCCQPRDSSDFHSPGPFDHPQMKPKTNKKLNNIHY